MNIHKYINIFLFLFPICFYGQIIWDQIPMDKSLVPRNESNKGYVSISGAVDNGENYTYIKIEVLKDGTFYSTFEYELEYIDNVAEFDFSLPIDAILANYAFKVYLKENGTYAQVNLPSGYGNNVVAGDVYVIQGQSNAVALFTDFEADGDNKDEFIRVLGSCMQDDRILTLPDQNIWKEAIGDKSLGSAGFIGQWGLKLGKLIVGLNDVPVAIFNGAKGGRPVAYFKKDAPPDASQTTNNYDRLYYRLNKTNLKESVKAIFWAQGENDASTSDPQNYIDDFEELKYDWLTNDYPNVEKIYMFQTKSGCNSASNIALNVKEAQRRLALESDVHIMQTTGLTYYLGQDVKCHFVYSNGYEEFANRIYKLVDRDFYGAVNYNSDIEPPTIIDAYLTSDTNLVLKTNAISLSAINPPITDFVLNQAGGATISSITTSGNSILITLSQKPDSNASISYEGLGAGENVNSLIVNSENLELVCFKEFQIDKSLVTIWDGQDWSRGFPDSTQSAIFDGDFSGGNMNIEVNDLIVNSLVNVNFESEPPTTNSILVNGGLTINGSLTLGDTESLLIKNTNAAVTVNGTFTKKEKTTQLKSTYDVTYWSTPVSNVSFNSVFVFNGVDANRIFYYNSKDENSNYTGNYDKYRHWFNIESASDLMTPGQGYSVDGANNGGYPKQMEFSFRGTPNYQDITIQIGTFNPRGDDDVNRVNLLGNPYPSAIDAIELINQNQSKFDGTLYFWTHAQNYESGEYSSADYLTYNLTGSNDSKFEEPYYIASGQGFMILTDKSNTDFEFTNDMQRAGGNNQFFKSGKSKKGNLASSTKNRIWIEIEKDQVIRKQILIGFTDLATDDYDKGYDGKLINSDPVITFYSLIKEDKYAVQGLGGNPINKKIDLGFSTKEGGRFKMGISKKEGILSGYKIILRDKKLNFNHDLNHSDYIFNENEIGDFTDRFELKFKHEKSQINGKADASPSFSVVNYERGFSFQCSKKVEAVTVYDIFGRLLYKSSPNKKSFIITTNRIKKGTIVIINSQVEEGQLFIRKMIKY